MTMTSTRRSAVLAVATSALATATSVPAFGQPAFPLQKAITLVVPFSPGGGNDILARAIAPEMGQSLGQTIVVDNRPGAGRNIGAEFVAHAAPDGSTVVIASSQATMNPLLDMRVPFRIERDFAPVGLIASVPLLLVANSREPYKNFQEFMAYARVNPGKVSYSSPGVGTPQNMAGEVFAKLNNAEMLHVPYRGTGPSIADLIGGQVQVSFATFASVAQHVRSGKLRALGIAGPKRAMLVPEVPTFGESGMANYDAGLWYSLLAPGKTPKQIVDKLNWAMLAAVQDPAVAKQLLEQGFEIQASTPAELKAYIDKELVQSERVIKEDQIKVSP